MDDLGLRRSLNSLLPVPAGDSSRSRFDLGLSPADSSSPAAATVSGPGYRGAPLPLDLQLQLEVGHWRPATRRDDDPHPGSVKLNFNSQAGLERHGACLLVGHRGLGNHLKLGVGGCQCAWTGRVGPGPGWARAAHTNFNSAESGAYCQNLNAPNPAPREAGRSTSNQDTILFWLTE